VAGWALAAALPATAQVHVPGPGGTVQSGTVQSGTVQPGTGQPGLLQPGGPITQPSSPAAGDGSQAPAGGQNAVVTSTNWAGYAATGSAGQFTGVSSSWTQPAGQCDMGNQYAAFWVGLDGYSSSTVEQIGSEVDCVDGTAQYYAWYELYPGSSVNFANPVQPGDHLTGSVAYQGSDQFKLTLADTTQGWTQSLTKTLAGAQRSSAEVITEAPADSTGTLPLTNFGSVDFSGATVNDAGLCTTSPTQIIMPGTSVSDLSSCGDFSLGYTGMDPGLAWLLGGL
jgi:hypothetical protein